MITPDLTAADYAAEFVTALCPVDPADIDILEAIAEHGLDTAEVAGECPYLTPAQVADVCAEGKRQAAAVLASCHFRGGLGVDSGMPLVRHATPCACLTCSACGWLAPADLGWTTVASGPLCPACQ